MKRNPSYLSYARAHWPWLVAGPLFIAMGGVCEVIQPRFMARIVDDAINGEGLSQSARMAIIGENAVYMVLLALLAIAVGVLGIVFISNGTFRFGASLRKGLYRKVLGYSHANIDKFSSASLVTRLTNDVTNVQNTFIQTLRMVTFTAAMFTGALINALSVSAKLALVTVFAVPVIAVIVTIIVTKGFPLFEKMQQRIDNLNRRVQESVTNIRVIKSFVREDHEKAKFYDAADRLCDISVKASGLMVTIMPLMQLVMNLTTGGALWLGGNMVQSGEIAIGGLMSYSTYIMHILMSMMMMSMAIMMFSRARASAARLKEVLAEQSTITDPEHPVTAPVQKGEVEFRHVSFRYNETSPDLVLDDVSFTAHPGEVIAVVGATGSAKSSLVNLIPRLYDATDGQVLVDGVDVRDYAIRTLREGIGMVPQQNVLFSGTIADNIRWGDPDATDDEVEQAARDAQAHDFIMSFPEGYQTMLSQGGVNVSGGQKQRLCIARAMIKKPRVLILDDSTSAVDSDTEGRIRESFSQHLKGTTVFIIAQRISSIKTADRILVLDSGKVAGFGTHEELIASNTIYQEIVSSQQKGVSA